MYIVLGRIVESLYVVYIYNSDEYICNSDDYIYIIVTTKNGYTLALQIQHLRTDIATIHRILIIMNVTLNVQSYRSAFGS